MVASMTATHLRDPALDPILAAIRDHGVTHLDVIHRSRLIDRILNSAMQRARLNNLYHYNAAKKPVAYNFLPFTAEDEALAAIVSTMEWSDRFRDFFSMNAKKLGQMMAAEKTFKAFIRDWQRADSATQLDILKSMAAKQLALFKHDGLTPQAPEIVIGDGKQNIAGSFNKGAWGLSLRIQDKTVHINRELMAPGKTPELCRTLWHEHVHSLCQQFAASCQAGDLTVTNPFYADARMKRARLDNTTTITDTFPKAYAADPEEKLAYLTEKIFTDSWEQHSGWRIRLG